MVIIIKKRLYFYHVLYVLIPCLFGRFQDYRLHSCTGYNFACMCIAIVCLRNKTDKFLSKVFPLIGSFLTTAEVEGTLEQIRSVQSCVASLMDSVVQAHAERFAYLRIFYILPTDFTRHVLL